MRLDGLRPEAALMHDRPAAYPHQYVFAKELGELENSRYFTRLLRNRNRLEVLATYDAVMNKVRMKPVPSWDRIPVRKKAAT